MATLWSAGKKSAIFGVRLLSKLLIKSFALKHDEPLNLFALDAPHEDVDEAPFQTIGGN